MLNTCTQTCWSMKPQLPLLLLLYWDESGHRGFSKTRDLPMGRSSGGLYVPFIGQDRVDLIEMATATPLQQLQENTYVDLVQGCSYGHLQVTEVLCQWSYSWWWVNDPEEIAHLGLHISYLISYLYTRMGELWEKDILYQIQLFRRTAPPMQHTLSWAAAAAWRLRTVASWLQGCGSPPNLVKKWWQCGKGDRSQPCLPVLVGEETIQGEWCCLKGNAEEHFQSARPAGATAILDCHKGLQNPSEEG